MQCACSIDVDYNSNDFYHDKVVKAVKPHVCGECGEEIKAGEQYEIVRGKNDHWFTEKTCMPCREVRNCYCCGWLFGHVFEHIDNESMDISLSALENLSPAARDKFFQFVRV